MRPKKIAFVLAWVVAVGLAFYFDLWRFMRLDTLEANRQALLNHYVSHKSLLAVGFMTVYAVVATTIGATLAFLVTRYLFRDAVLRKFGSKLEGINRELEARGFNYLIFFTAGAGLSLFHD